jgi:hypothetical protein
VSGRIKPPRQPRRTHLTRLIFAFFIGFAGVVQFLGVTPVKAGEPTTRASRIGVGFQARGAGKSCCAKPSPEGSARHASRTAPTRPRCSFCLAKFGFDKQQWVECGPRRFGGTWHWLLASGRRGHVESGCMGGRNYLRCALPEDHPAPYRTLERGRVASGHVA